MGKATHTHKIKYSVFFVFVKIDSVEIHTFCLPLFLLELTKRQNDEYQYR